MKHTHFGLVAVSAALVFLVAATGVHPSDDQALVQEKEAPASLADLAWMVGAWRHETKEQILEEHWAPAAGNSMIGMFRWLKKGKGWVYEFLLIEETAAGLVFHLRHFGPGSVAWEDKKAPLSFPFLKKGKQQVVFDNPERKSPRRMTYSRKGDELTVTVQGNLESKGNSFRLKRI